MQRIKFFLPTRKGSERVINKNTRPFAGVEGGILRIKLEQLLKVGSVEEIVVSTNDLETIKVVDLLNNDRIRVVERPESLCLSTTNIEDFINYIPEIMDCEHIFWVHATAPFVNEIDYERALNEYFNVINQGEHDSVASVTKIQQFIWDPEKSDFINHDRSKLKWPRTQDLKPVYEINHAFYINSLKNYLDFSDRIGKKPYMYTLDKIKSFDIDWQDDFDIAEILYRNLVIDNQLI